jgi:hypothetical protein
MEDLGLDPTSDVDREQYEAYLEWWVFYHAPAEAFSTTDSRPDAATARRRDHAMATCRYCASKRALRGSVAPVSARVLQPRATAPTNQTHLM